MNVLNQAPIGQTQMLGHRIGRGNKVKFRWRGVERKSKPLVISVVILTI